MSSSNIRGDNVNFVNNSVPKDISLQHENPKYQLKFNSDIIFNNDTNHNTITLGRYQINAGSDGSLIIKKNGKISFRLD